MPYFFERGSILFGLHAEKEKRHLWYEKFLDARLARPVSFGADDAGGAHNANFHLMLNHTAHEMKNMLVEQVASILFSCVNVLNCISTVQKYKKTTNANFGHALREPFEKLHLELDPESVDYLIPNSGLVGFRFLVHETPEPHWVHHQAAVFLGAQFHTMLRLVGTRKLPASIQLWAFLREANRNVFHELMSLDETLLSLHRIIKVMQDVVKVIGQAANYSRGGGSRLMNSLLRAGGKKSTIFDENCLDQAEHTGMLTRVSQLSNAFTNRLQESFLFDMTQDTVQLNLIMIFLQRNPLDFSRLLSDLRISDLISDVTVLDLRRNGQKCLDAAYSLNGLLSNFTMRGLYSRNSSISKASDLPRGNENIISSLQAMLLATDSNLNKLSVKFSHLYGRNKILIQEMRSLLSSQSSMEQRHSRVAVSVEVSSRQAELLDILTSAVMIGSLLVLLVEGVFTTVWECRLRPHIRASEDLPKHDFEHRMPEGIPSSLSPPPLASLSHQQIEAVVPVSTGVPQPLGGSPRYVYSLPRDRTGSPAYSVKWNHLTFARPHKFAGQLMCQREQQHPRFLDITESTSGINTPSTSTHPLSDVV
ncbi:hypothetical protein TSMEX_006294 [Taenia solium]|eukprot:TsM_000200400 transcript=TsM_000200400 gene=TsM_000200400